MQRSLGAGENSGLLPPLPSSQAADYFQVQMSYLLVLTNFNPVYL